MCAAPESCARTTRADAGLGRGAHDSGHGAGGGRGQRAEIDLLSQGPYNPWLGQCRADGSLPEGNADGQRCGLVVCCAVAAEPVHDVQGAHAAAFAVRTQSAYGQGTSFAGIAAGGSLSSMFWNPANLADVRAERDRSGRHRHLPGRRRETRSRRRRSASPGSDEGNIADEHVRPGRLRGLPAA